MIKRKIVIGDLHGNINGVENILNKMSYDHTTDHLIFVGDYCDHLPDKDANVKKLVSYLIAIQKENTHTTFLKGNHDHWFFYWMKTNIPASNLRIWYAQGGKETLLSYNKRVSEYLRYDDFNIPKSHYEFFKHLVPYYYDNDIVTMHGGISDTNILAKIKDNKTLTNSELDDIMWDRSFYKTTDTELLQSYLNIFSNRIFICGHTPYGPVFNINGPFHRILIDGGSKGGGSLYAAIIYSRNDYEIYSESEGMLDSEQIKKLII